MTDRRQQQRAARIRFRVHLLMGAFVAVLCVLVGRAAQLQLVDHETLARKGELRYHAEEPVVAHRGEILDRNGELLAMSTPVDSIGVDPSSLQADQEDLRQLAVTLDVRYDELLRQVTASRSRQFIYLRRHLPPPRAAAALRLPIEGLVPVREYRRYYPAGEVTSHVLGFTSIDDAGLEGLELAYDHVLKGVPGRKRVLRDRHGRIIEDVESIQRARPGRALTVSLDLRLQYVAYRALKAAVREHRAASGSVVILDVASGEVLAMVNQPGYNPNSRHKSPSPSFRNRAVTDIFEPGSVFKTMVMAAALESGAWSRDSLVDTSPGEVRVGSKVIRDSRNLGQITATRVLARSSNVGIVRIAQSLDPAQLWSVLHRLGFGEVLMSGFPGESAGLLRDHQGWRELGQATLSYGYGLSVTPLQLARAYAVIGNGGLAAPVTFIRQERPPRSQRVLRESVADELLAMLEQVVAPDATGRQAAVPGYRIAGKTGTARKSADGGYAQDRYLSVFAGLAPASDPRLAVVVLIDDPAAGAYYGGDVAAPVFAQIVSDALRLLAIPPDAPGEVEDLAIAYAAGAAADAAGEEAP